jgi:hypothetical protein
MCSFTRAAPLPKNNGKVFYSLFFFSYSKIIMSSQSSSENKSTTQLQSAVSNTRYVKQKQNVQSICYFRFTLYFTLCSEKQYAPSTLFWKNLDSDILDLKSYMYSCLFHLIITWCYYTCTCHVFQARIERRETERDYPFLI